MVEWLEYVIKLSSYISSLCYSVFRLEPFTGCGYGPLSRHEMLLHGLWSVNSCPWGAGGFRRAGGGVAGVEALRRSVEGLGGRVEVEGDRVLLVFDQRGFALVDLPVEALRELTGYRETVIVERGAGHGGVDYYYYISRGEVEGLIERLRGSSGER